MRTLVTTATILATAVLVTTAVPSTASADLWARCAEDQLYTDSQVQGRNGWAFNCGYIDQATRDFGNSQGLYVVFTTGSYGGNPNIPVTATAACITGLVKAGLCMKGCYTPDQELMFDGESMSIEQAYLREAPSVTALTPDATLGDLEYAEQSIEAFIAGETHEPIFVLEGDKGQSLRVTSGHPMVLESGQVVAARSLSPGDVLTGADGEPIELLAIDVVDYEGMVWNLQPRSEDKAENILVAQGYLTGSVRFQNQWANDMFRLAQRNSVKLPDELADE